MSDEHSSLPAGTRLRVRFFGSWLGTGNASITINELEVSREGVNRSYAAVIRHSLQKAFAQIEETK